MLDVSLQTEVLVEAADPGPGGPDVGCRSRLLSCEAEFSNCIIIDILRGLI